MKTMIFHRSDATSLLQRLMAGTGYCLLLAIATLQAQTPLPKNATYQQIKERWSGASRDELRKAAESGVADAQLYFGFTEIKAAEEENSQATRWSTKAFSNGPDLSESELAAFRTKWLAVPEAQHRRAAESGDRGAQTALAHRESERASAHGWAGFEWIKKAAAQALVIAEEETVKRYLGLSGWMVIKPDEVEGMRWLESAATHKSEWAQHKLADFLLAGRNAAPDLVRGLEALRQCADQDCPRAQYELAMFYTAGDGEPLAAYESPVELLRKSARVGYNKALKALADRYRAGLGVDRDFVRASELYHAAIVADARVDYEYRSRADQVLDLVDQKREPKSHSDPKTARFAEVLGLYLKATEQRDAKAMHAIGEMYRRGENVPKDAAAAFQWFSLAGERGQPAAVTARDSLKSALSKEDLERANGWLEERKASSSKTH